MDTLIIRPASYEEVLKIDHLIDEIPLTSQMPCPCVMSKVDLRVLYIGFPPHKLAGISWRQELPSFADWYVNRNTSRRCKTCGINIIWERRFCCKNCEKFYLRYKKEPKRM